jgi:hypothetical protein
MSKSTVTFPTVTNCILLTTTGVYRSNGLRTKHEGALPSRTEVLKYHMSEMKNKIKYQSIYRNKLAVPKLLHRRRIPVSSRPSTIENERTV